MSQLATKIRIEEEIIAQALVSFDRLPMLDVILERFATSVSGALGSHAGANTSTALTGLTYLPYAASLAHLPDPCLLAIAGVDGSGGGLAVAMDAGFLYAALEMMMGGRSGTAPAGERRSFTSIERRLGHRLAEVVLTDLSTSFSQVADIGFAVTRMETSAQLAAIGEAGSPCILAELDVTLNDRPGRLAVLLPLATLDPVRHLLKRVFFGEKLGTDHSWRDHLTDRITASNVTLTSILHQLSMPLTDVLAWTAGTTLDLRIDADHEATVHCAGVPVFRGSMGRRKNGSVALRITQDLTDGKTWQNGDRDGIAGD